MRCAVTRDLKAALLHKDYQPMTDVIRAALAAAQEG
jgi:hypothetical protein